jgi:T-complex protein 1 subunit zeta
VIARTATAQDDVTGDGTTSNVLFTGELLKQAERYISEGLHPRVVVEGFELARDETLKYLDTFLIEQDAKQVYERDLLVQVAQTSLRTKVNRELADHLTQIVVDAVLTIAKKEDEQPLDLHMIEIMHMRHKTAMHTRFIDGIVCDHGVRHPNMRTRSENCFMLTCNVSFEYEKSMISAGIFYKNAEERQKMVAAERKATNDQVQRVIDFKHQLCSGDKKDWNFVIINQKGIDPISLDMFYKAGIVGIRRAKKRNMERMTKACGGVAINSLTELKEENLGFAKLVYEHTLGEDKFTFIEGCKNASSCTILINGPNDHTIRQIKDALRDGLRAVKNVLEDRKLLPGAGSFEAYAHLHLLNFQHKVEGRARLGVKAFADALLVIPKTLAKNSGHDAQGTAIALLTKATASLKAASESKQPFDPSSAVGVDIVTGGAMQPAKAGIYDGFRVKQQFLHLGSLIAVKLLLIDEILRAGRKMGGK